MGQGEPSVPFSSTFLLMIVLTEDCPRAGVLGLLTGLGQVSGQMSGTGPVEVAEGGGEPGGGPQKEGTRGMLL